MFPGRSINFASGVDVTEAGLRWVWVMQVMRSSSRAWTSPSLLPTVASSGSPGSSGLLRRAVWPSREGKLADRLNTLPKYVVSSTLEDPEWNNATVLKGDVVKEVWRLKEELDGEIVVPGSIQLGPHADRAGPRRRAAPAGLPGRARRRRAPLGETSDKKPMRLVGTAGDNVAFLTYEPVRDP